MDRLTRRLFVAAIVAIVAVTGGAAILLSGPGPSDPDAPAGAASVVGVIVRVDAPSIADVRAIDLRLADGTIRTFGLGELENGDEFPPGHLAEHQVTAEPVRVWFRIVEGTPEAIRLEDAPR